MKVKDAKKMLAKFDDEQEIVLLDEARMGHDDAVLGFSIVAGFMNDENDDDVRLEKVEAQGLDEDDENYDEEFEASFTTPCCVISFWK